MSTFYRNKLDTKHAETLIRQGTQIINLTKKTNIGKMKTREQAEARALELFPIEDFPFREDAERQEELRKAFLQCFDEMNQHKDISKTCGYCVKPSNEGQKEALIKSVTNCPTCGADCDVKGDGETHYYLPKDKQICEAAEKVLNTYRNSPTEEPIIEALQELEKALK